MVDASEVVDLCDSEEEELPLQHVGESTVTFTGLPVVEEFRGSLAEVLPCLARRFINNVSGFQRKRDSVHLRLQEETINTGGPGYADFTESNIRVESVFSVPATSCDTIHVSSKKQKTCSTIIEPVVDSVLKGTRCIEEIIEIDDDSGDGPPVVEPSDSGSCHRALSLAQSWGSAVASDQCESMDVADHSSTGPSEPHSLSLNLNVAPQPIFLHSPASSPELRILTPEPDLPPSVLHSAPPSRLIDDEQLVEMPECRYPNDEETSPPYSTDDDEEDGERGGSASSTDGDSENSEARFPRTLYCIYCDYSTVVEEWYHKHIAGHLPGTKPYCRLYCTDCSYSTGSEKFLLFHMYRTHNIRNPKFYRSGEKRYTCRLCKHTLELRIDIESHIKKKHIRTPKVMRKQHPCVRAKPKEKPNGTSPLNGTKFKCVGLGWDSLEGCSRCTYRFEELRLHIEKLHNIKFPWVYEVVSRSRSIFVEYGCFACDHKASTLKNMRKHARTHYTRHQLRAPLLYKCPLYCAFTCRMQSEILEHFQFVHPSEVPYYRKVASCKTRDSPSIYACIFCPFVDSSEEKTVSHCVECAQRKKKIIT